MDLVVLTQPVSASYNGHHVRLRKGHVASADDPFVRDHPHLFAPFVVEDIAPVETATAEPGEKRPIRRRPKSSE